MRWVAKVNHWDSETIAGAIASGFGARLAGGLVEVVLEVGAAVQLGVARLLVIWLNKQLHVEVDCE